MRARRLAAGLLALGLWACEGTRPPAVSAPAFPPASELESNTPPVPADEPLAKVFAPLDGRWRGQFQIYTDTRGQQPGPRPSSLDPAAFAQAPFKLSQTIEVEQVYTSESPYFQRVEIRDTYRDSSGQTKTAESRGVNKVQGGQLWCLVKKPDETVIHTGSTEGADTIVWQRELQNPTKVEYFRETVRENTYTIVGYGYYGGDDPKKTPRTYFYGQYKRAE